MSTILSLYAALLGVLLSRLSVKTFGVRRKQRISIGTGNSSEMPRAVRVHANLAEYVPLVLVLLCWVE